MIAKICSECDHWNKIEDGKGGICLRWPPTVQTHLLPRPAKPRVIGVRQQGVQLEIREVMARPKTEADEPACGEFKHEE